MKFKPFLLLPLTALALIGCNDPSASSSVPGSSSDIGSSEDDPRTPITKAIDEARLSVNITTENFQRVFNSKTDEPVFDNEYTYIYGFDAHDQVKTAQSYTTESGLSLTQSYVRDDSGYAAVEYVNAKNELSLAPVYDADGYRFGYDHYYSNPFLYLAEADLTQVEGGYEVNAEIRDYLSFLFFGNTHPVESMILYFDGTDFTGGHIQTYPVDGFTMDLPDGTQADEYYQIYYYFEATMTFEGAGSYRVESPELSPEGTYGAPVVDLLNKVGDNYTLSSNVYLAGTPKDPNLTSTTYFDGSTCYVDYELGDPTFANDVIYAPDPYEGDGLLYEYAYDGESWGKAPADSSSAYNVDPKGVEYFSLAQNTVSPSIIGPGATGLTVINESALRYCGNAFLPGVCSNPYYDIGYILGIDISFTSDSLTLLVDFVVPSNIGYYELMYEYVYTDIGTTVVPVSI